VQGSAVIAIAVVAAVVGLTCLVFLAVFAVRNADTLFSSSGLKGIPLANLTVAQVSALLRHLEMPPETLRAVEQRRVTGLVLREMALSVPVDQAQRTSITGPEVDAVEQYLSLTDPYKSRALVRKLKELDRSGVSVDMIGAAPDVTDGNVEMDRYSAGSALHQGGGTAVVTVVDGGDNGKAGAYISDTATAV